MNVSGKVLIIDSDQPSRRGSDEPGIAEELKKYLPDIVVDHADNVDEAVHLASGTPYDLFIIGMEMRGLDGISLASALSGLNGYEDVPYIFVSTAASVGRKIKKQFPDVDFFVKPRETRGREFAGRVERVLTLVQTLSNLKWAVAELSAAYRRQRYSGEDVDVHREIAT